MKITLFLILSLFSLSLSLVPPVPAKPCPCKCFIKNSFTARKSMAKRQCNLPQFSSKCTTFKCFTDNRIGFECCDKFRPKPSESPTPTPSATPSVSPQPSKICPCTCRQGGKRATRAAKKECKKYPPYCSVRSCGFKKFQCCY